MDAKTIAKLHAETIDFLRTYDNRNDDHFKIFNELEAYRMSRFEDFKKLIPGCDWKFYKPTSQKIKEAQEDMYRKAILASREAPALIKPLRDFFLKPFNSRERFDLIAGLGDSESIEMVLDKVEEQFEKDVDDDIDKSAFHGLVEIAEFPAYTERVRKLVSTGFDKCIKSADGTIFNILGTLCVLMDYKEAANKVFKAFVFASHEEQHYEMNTVASRLVLYLTALDYDGPVDKIKKYIDYFDDAYKDEEFVVRARYAYWWLRKESQEALDFLANREKKRSLGIVAAFLADINEQKALPILEARISDLKNQVTIEVFKEAIARLKSHNGYRTSERMIWMFGYVTPTEQVLGEGSDNIFMHRANEVSSSNLEVMHEADESTAED